MLMWGIGSIQARDSMRFVSMYAVCGTGVPFQVNVGNKYNLEAGLGDRCSARRGDFQSLPFEDAQFDAAYQIEATCHSPDKVSLLTIVSCNHVEQTLSAATLRLRAACNLGRFCNETKSR